MRPSMSRKIDRKSGSEGATKTENISAGHTPQALDCLGANTGITNTAAAAQVLEGRSNVIDRQRHCGQRIKAPNGHLKPAHGAGEMIEEDHPQSAARTSPDRPEMAPLARGEVAVPFEWFVHGVLTMARHFGELLSLAPYATIVVIEAMRDNDEDF
jgi:hypothetical protein